MIIDLNKLNVTDILISDEFDLQDYIKNNPNIRDLKNIKAVGKIYYNVNNDIAIDLHVTGIMVLIDAVTLEDIEKTIEFDIEEIITENNDVFYEYYQKEQNTLDIMGILWQNIVLEVPIRVTSSESATTLSGEGWELIEDIEKRIDPRLAKLAELLDEGKE